MSLVGQKSISIALEVFCILFVGVWESDQIFSEIIDGWIFKMLMDLIDTPIIYGIIHLLKGKIDIAEIEE